MDPSEIFDQYRPLLFSIAYRMLGSVMDAEDVVQEALSALAAGWGKTRAALNPIYGAERVSRFLFGILRKAPPGLVVRRARVNGRPGLIGYFRDGRPQSVTTLEVAEGRILAIRIVVNPEKLGALPPLERVERGEGPG